MSLLFVPPYSPELNPWKKLINLIKVYIEKKLVRKGKSFLKLYRVISLNIIKCAIDSKSEKQWRGFVAASLKETQHLLQIKIVK